MATDDVSKAALIHLTRVLDLEPPPARDPGERRRTTTARHGRSSLRHPCQHNMSLSRRAFECSSSTRRSLSAAAAGSLPRSPDSSDAVSPDVPGTSIVGGDPVPYQIRQPPPRPGGARAEIEALNLGLHGARTVWPSATKRGIRLNDTSHSLRISAGSNLRSSASSVAAEPVRPPRRTRFQPAIRPRGVVLEHRTAGEPRCDPAAVSLPSKRRCQRAAGAAPRAVVGAAATRRCDRDRGHTERRPDCRDPN
jgi:hypothetical protein